MYSKARIVSFTLVSFSYIFLVMSCNGGKLGDLGFGNITLPSTPPTTTPPPVLPGTSNGLLDDTKNFYVGVDTSSGAIAHVHANTGFSSACGVSLDSTTNTDITCLIDVPEGDLFAKDLELKYNAPKGMCRYLLRTPYWFYNYEVGVGPNTISATIANTYDASGDLTGTTYSCSFNGGAPGPCTTNPEVTVDLSPTAATFKCVYDGTLAEKPNCCFGNNAITTNITRNAVLESSATVPGEWGGTFDACIGGQGKTSWEAKKDGRPLSVITYAQEGVNNKDTISAPLGLGIGTNMHVANYSGGSATHTHNGFVSATTSNSPYFVAPIDDRSGTAIGSTSGAYEFQCLDQGFEILHRIRVYVRDWDTYPDYLAFISSAGVTAVPDRGTDAEPGTNCNSIPSAGYLCNDHADPDDLLSINLRLPPASLPGPTYDTVDVTKRGYYFPGLGY